MRGGGIDGAQQGQAGKRLTPPQPSGCGGRDLHDINQHRLEGAYPRPQGKSREMNDTKTVVTSHGSRISYDAIISACSGKPYLMSLTGDDAWLVAKAVSVGIDSRLQACSVPERGDSYEWVPRRAGDKVLCYSLECRVSPGSLPVLLKRLTEDTEFTAVDGDAYDIGCSLADDILTTLGFDESGVFVGREALGLE